MILSKNSTILFVNKKNDFLPQWHQSHRLWLNLLSKTLDPTYKIQSNYLQSHPLINNKMRSVLFDWLIEVCEVYHLHRETYHLAIAYIDQYLSKTNDFPKGKFQLLGIAALFVAAKIEEIYPPHLADFAYVTDETCTEDDILQMEIQLMNTLNWHINPITSISWLLVYLQSEYDLNKSSNSKDILQTSKLTKVHQSKDFLHLFSSVVRLLDLCSLDIEYSQFSKHILAASAILFYKTDWPLKKLTNINANDLFVCHEWMKPFHEVLSKHTMKTYGSSSISNEESYSIQTHNISIDLLENVYEYRSNTNQLLILNRPLRNLDNYLPSLSVLNSNNSIDIFL